jgi:hypothetical protein
MGSHGSFGHLKHKLWPKERLGVKLAVWLLTIKSRELTWFSCVQVACHIPLESSWRGLQLCFIPHLNRRFVHKVMGPQNRENPNFGNFGIPKLGQNVIWMWASWRDTKYTIRGKVMASPKSRPWWVLWAQVCLWFVLTPKMLKLCTNQLVVWFVQVRVSNWCLSLFLILISELQHAPLPPKCREPKNVPQLFVLPMFSP